MWGLDTIKTRGESVAIALSLIGARPVKEGTGRVVKYELVPLEELKRPRVDVLASLSGIFRDTFANVVDLLDDLFENAATAEVSLNNWTHFNILGILLYSSVKSTQTWRSERPGGSENPRAMLCFPWCVERGAVARGRLLELSRAWGI